MATDNVKTRSSQRFSLRAILLISSIVAPLIPFIAAMAIGYYYFSTSLRSNTITHLERILVDHSRMIDAFLLERRADLTLIADGFSFDELAREGRLQATFTNLVKVSKAFVDLGVFNQEGLHVAYVGPYQLTGRSYSDAELFRAVMRNGVYISDVFLGYRRIPHFIIAIAKEEDGRKWVLRATIDTQLFNQLVEEIQIGQTGEAYLLNPDGVFQTKRRMGGHLMEKDPEIETYPLLKQGINTFKAKDPSGETYLVTTTWLKEKDWLLVVRQAKSDAYAALNSAAFRIVLISAVGVVVILLFAFQITAGLIRRMEQMAWDKEHLGLQLIRATRLAELGEMAAGFAHEINNPLQIIKAEQALSMNIILELCEKEAVLPTDALAELQDSMQQINLQINRCAEITQAILNFGRKSEPAMTDIELRTFIPEIISMISKKAEVHGIAIEDEIAAEMPPVHGDPAQLQQVLLNLLNNAIDAILERHGASGGRLTIGAGAEDGDQVKIYVKDNGSGISDENLKKIFRPFFTTKPVGKGTGLGLSVCYGIIDRIGGTMEVQSQEGKGTVFKIRLPKAP